jgi:hypothetical protein
MTMDPLIAIGLAGSVVQFVSFACNLISKTKEIHGSSAGVTKDGESLEVVYSRLLGLSSSLGLGASSCFDDERDLGRGVGVGDCGDTCSTTVVGGGDAAVAKHVVGIRDLSRVCEVDCRKLLEIVGRLRRGGGEGNANRKWRSFRAAVATIWKSGEIRELEGRLHLTQSTLTLHICALTM